MQSFANGDRMPIVGLGTWKSEPGQVYNAVREALRLGYRHIDCAPLYGNEVEIGSALRDALSDGDVTRSELWITSKLWGSSHGRDNVAPALEKTLADLGLEYVDLYLIHWPIPLKPTTTIPASGDDFVTPTDAFLASTWAGMESAVRDGRARHIGVSNFSSKKLRTLQAQCTLPVEVNQIELHPLLQQPELVSYCGANGIHVTAYSPLGSADRPEFFRAADAPVLLDDPVIRSIGDERGCTPAQVLIAWHVNRGISVIPKTVNLPRLRENLDAKDIELTAADLQRIERLNRNYRFLDGAFWAQPGSPWTLQTLWDEA